MTDKRRKKKTSRLYLRVFWYMLGFCVLLLLLLWLFLTVFLEQFYRAIKLREVEEQATVLAGYVRQGDYTALESAVRLRGDLYVEVLGADGTSYTVQDHYPEVRPSQLSAQQKQQLFATVERNGAGILQMDEQTPRPSGIPLPPERGEEMRRPENILHAELVQTESGEEKLLLLNAAVTPVNATVQTIQVLLGWISGIVLVLAVGIALLIARHVARPISRLNTAAKELGGGNYAARFEGGGYREIEELSATLNHAAGELSKTEELRRELIANVSHDLRTPLTLITGYAEMMRDIPGENSPENMQVIIDEAQRLSSLVGDLLELSRLESGTMEMHPELFNLTEAAGEILTRFSKFSQPEGFRLRFEKEEEVYVKADATRISQVIYNFLINAMHHSREKVITLRQTVQDGRVCLAVIDTGEGIPAESLPYIWDRYYKVDKVHRRATSGSGLGLSIVKNILKAHPGVEFGVNSQPGAGSVFWFSLPAEPVLAALKR